MYRFTAIPLIPEKQHTKWRIPGTKKPNVTVQDPYLVNHRSTRDTRFSDKPTHLPNRSISGRPTFLPMVYVTNVPMKTPEITSPVAVTTLSKPEDDKYPVKIITNSSGTGKPKIPSDRNRNTTKTP